MNLKVNRTDRNKLTNQNGSVFWLSGLPASGKTTISIEVEKILYKYGKLSYRLDGDNLRNGLCSDLGFSIDDRTENIRRISHVSKLMVESSVIILAAFVSPTNEIRKLASEIIGEDFYLIFIDSTVEECIKRDPKGLYKKALNGEIEDFTGISQEFEIPENPDLIINTNDLDINESAIKLVDFIIERI